VGFTLTLTDLSFPGPNFEPITESGEFDAMIGPDSADLQSVRFTFLHRPV